MGLSGIFRSVHIPFGIVVWLSVDNGVLELAGLDLGLGLIMGDFQEWFWPQKKRGGA
jgi:hypothetical protein